ncbi:MAG: histidinol-phosphatase, partial [Saprospiraceae bacterium]|nr:histidinol-phosphatase [Saprospiraceae bacterium]
MKKILFIDRDGTIIEEPPIDFQVDSFDKLDFIHGAIRALSDLARLDYKLVMVTNQDGLGTEAFPTASFQGPHDLMMRILSSEGVVWQEIIVDHSWPQDDSDARKPNLGRVQHYLGGDYDLENSFVIGDRLTDMLFAHNLGTKGIFLGKSLDSSEDHHAESVDLSKTITLHTENWPDVVGFIKGLDRVIEVSRDTAETKIKVSLNLDGSGQTRMHTGLGFFDHMLDQLGKHGGVDLKIKVEGDLEIDEHHTIEDTALVLGEAFNLALGSKRGVERYGYALPMDDCQASVLI